jgi:hypothetical protein
MCLYKCLYEHHGVGYGLLGMPPVCELAPAYQVTNHTMKAGEEMMGKWNGKNGRGVKLVLGQGSINWGLVSSWGDAAAWSL